MNVAGIDVNAKELVVVVSIKGKTGKAKFFENTAAGHQAIIRLLSKYKEESRVCLEATGIYHFDLAVALSRADGIEVMVLNPKVAHNYMTNGQNRLLNKIYARIPPVLSNASHQCPANTANSM